MALTTTLVSSFRQSISAPMLEGASGVVGGLILGDVVANYAVQAAKATTTTMSLLVKGISKFAVAAVSIAATTLSSGAWRVIGTSAAIGSVASFIVDLLAASPAAKTLGLAAVKAFQIEVPYGRRTSGVTVQTSAVGTKQTTINRV